MTLAERVRITDATIARVAGKPCVLGRNDCGLMVIGHIKAMGRPIVTLGTWKTAIGIKRFLRRHGGSGAACLDGWKLPRIAPAAAIVGDVVELAGEPPFGAFAVVVGNGRVLGWHEDVEGAAIMQPVVPPIAAWRV